MATEFDVEYHSMNAGAHRRPATKIGAPALTWQRAYWRPTLDINGNYLVPEADDDNWYYQIDCVLLYIYLELARKKGTECPNFETDGYIYLFSHKVLIKSEILELIKLKDDEKSVRHDVFSLRTSRHGLIVSVTARRHLEYFEILFATEFSNTIEKNMQLMKLVRFMMISYFCTNLQ